MVYIYKGQDNVITTDSFVDYIPETLAVKLDETVIGNYTNESSDKNYFVITIPNLTIDGFQNCEYKLRYFYYNEMIKEELCIIKDLSIIEPIKQKTKVKSVKFYE